mgnify:CR=1 FL=1
MVSIKVFRCGYKKKKFDIKFCEGANGKRTNGSRTGTLPFVFFYFLTNIETHISSHLGENTFVINKKKKVLKSKLKRERERGRVKINGGICIASTGNERMNELAGRGGLKVNLNLKFTHE